MDVQEGKGKKKGKRPVFKVLIKRRKKHIAKKTKLPVKRNKNTFTTELSLRRGINQPVKVIQKMNLFRKDLQRDALRRLAALNSVAAHKTTTKKLAKKEDK